MKIKITTEFNEFLKLNCKCFECKHNLVKRTTGGEYACRLKHVWINEKGECSEREINEDEA